MNDYHAQIRKRMGDPDAAFIYRGTDIQEVADLLQGGAVEGTTSDIITGSFDGDPPMIVDRGTPIGDLNWSEGPFVRPDAVTVTGGFTDRIEQTRRFRDSEFDLFVVVNPSMTDLVPVQYDWEWQNENAGVHGHIRTTATAEVRVDGEGLFGTCNNPPMADGTRVYRIEEWGPGSLSATSPESRFADEREWVSLSPTVSLSGAMEMVVSMKSEDSVRFRAERITDRGFSDDREAAAVYYEEMIDRLPPTSIPVVLVVLADGASAGPDGAFSRRDILFGYDETGFVEPEDVPGEAIGEQL